MTETTAHHEGPCPRFDGMSCGLCDEWERVHSPDSIDFDPAKAYHAALVEAVTAAQKMRGVLRFRLDKQHPDGSMDVTINPKPGWEQIYLDMLEACDRADALGGDPEAKTRARELKRRMP